MTQYIKHLDCTQDNYTKWN